MASKATKIIELRAENINPAEIAAPDPPQPLADSVRRFTGDGHEIRVGMSVYAIRGSHAPVRPATLTEIKLRRGKDWADVDFWVSTNQRVVPINYGDLYVSERQAVAERDRRRVKMDALVAKRKDGDA